MSKYPPSIVTNDLESCFFCQTKPVAIHHVFGGVNRKKSTEYGMVVGLCPTCHTNSNYAVHRNKENDLKLKQYTQAKFEETHTREEFMKIIGRNYL